MVWVEQTQEQETKMIIKQDDQILYKQPPGFYDFKSQDDVDTLKKVYDGETLLEYEKNITVEWDVLDINWLAGQHIVKFYPIWKQSNILIAGGPQLTIMTAFIDAVRAWSNTSPLPNPWDGSLEKITP